MALLSVYMGEWRGDGICRLARWRWPSRTLSTSYRRFHTFTRTVVWYDAKRKRNVPACEIPPL